MTVNPEESQATKPGFKKYAIAALILSSICAIIASIWGIMQFLNKPLDPPLGIIESPPASTSICSETGTLLIMVLGVDLPETDFPKGADAIRFVEVDFTNQEISILAVPRDLWVSTPVLSAQGVEAERIGQSYFMGKNLATYSEDEVRIGTFVLAQTFYDNFGLIPDHYLTLNMEAFAKMVDSFSGVVINIPEDFEGGRFSFSAGEQLISGDMLMDYSRTFLVGTEWDRLNRQDLALEALKRKILSASIILEIPTLLSQFDDVVTTDLTPLQFINLGCMVQLVSYEDIQFVEISSDMVSIDINNIMLPDKSKIITLINSLFEE